jgi:L,D-transpeptidase catalytic domain
MRQFLRDRPSGSAPRRIGLAAVGLAIMALAAPLRADDALPPWTERTDVPLPTWARSVTPNKPESAIYAEPGKIDQRRGSAQPGARLPLFATKRAAGCQGRWLEVGPFAWICSDVADFSAEDPASPVLGTRPWSVSGTSRDDLVRPLRPGARSALPPIEPVSTSDDGLPYRYYFAGRDGAFGFANLASALDDAPDQELEPGFAVAILEETTAHGQRWGRTKKGRWVSMRELVPVRPNLFHGELLATDDAPGGGEPKLDIAWVVADRANVYASEKADKAGGTRVRFEKVQVWEERAGKDGGLVRVSPPSDAPVWMRARDLARPRVVAPPPEVAAAASGGETSERWIDVDLASQTLVAYAGKHPVFATIVSTGKGALGSDFVTHTGTFRIWVKVFTTKMDNLDKDEVDRHYAIEDVPWVQFFDKAIALHGAFWHRDFGRVHSHGCVNLAPLDARWLYAFTAPHLPAGWTAVLPTKIEQGTVIHVH